MLLLILPPSLPELLVFVVVGGGWPCAAGRGVEEGRSKNDRSQLLFVDVGVVVLENAAGGGATGAAEVRMLGGGGFAGGCFSESDCWRW